MTEEGEYITEWRRLSEQYLTALDNPRKLRMLQKAFDKLWAKINREK